MGYIVNILIVIAVIYYITQLFVITGFNKLKKKNISTANFSRLKISVIIPVRNEQDNIENCLHSLLNQNYEKEDYEILIVNDHSKDNTVKLISELNTSIVSLVNLENKTGKKEALKYGIKKAQYDTIVTTDADCYLPADWLNTIARFMNNGTDMLLGPVVLGRCSGFFNAFQQLDMMAMQAAEFGLLHYHQPILNNAANLAFKKDKYIQINGYDNYNTPSGDDVFLLEKFKSNKYKIEGVLKNNFVVETEPSKGIKEFINQRVRWASKSKFYRDKILILYALIIFFQNLAQLFIYYHVLFIEKFRMIYIILLLTKWLIDFILLFLVATFFKRKSSLLYFIPVQLIYPFYIMGVSIASTFMKYEWKGRKY